MLVKADQDSRPDLSNRYEDYGWPATIVFAADGSEIVKRQGYMPPREMASMLRAIILDPSPGPSVTAEKKLQYSAQPDFTPTLQTVLNKGFVAQYDAKEGGWGFGHKYLEADSVEYAMTRARQGDDASGGDGEETLGLERQLLDPVWGGAYQYSATPDWHEPHFEKIMAIQTDTMRLYALAYLQWHDPEYLKAAESIHGYLKSFLLSPEGAFYVSQDADVVPGEHSAAYFKLDDAARRKQGVPRVDQHLYARENGWVINALCQLYAATGNQEYLGEAQRAAQWVIANRSLGGGGFRHDAKDAAGPYLGDTAAMAQAFLALYSVTGERDWLARSRMAMQYVAANFKSPTGAGFVTAKGATKMGYAPHPQRDENIAVARTANLLFQYTGDASFQATAKTAMRYLATPEIAKQFPVAGALLAEEEFARPAVHLTVVGRKDDAAAKALFQTAIAYPSAYKRVEWWDRREGAMPNSDVQYPELKNAAAFLCTDRLCSSPAYSSEKLTALEARR